MDSLGFGVQGLGSDSLGSNLVLRPEWHQTPLEELYELDALVGYHGMEGSGESRMMIDGFKETPLLELGVHWRPRGDSNP